MERKKKAKPGDAATARAGQPRAPASQLEIGRTKAGEDGRAWVVSADEKLRNFWKHALPPGLLYAWTSGSDPAPTPNEKQLQEVMSSAVLLQEVMRACMHGEAEVRKVAALLTELNSPAVRERVEELMLVAQAIKRGKASYEADGNYVSFAHPVSVADVFESCVIPHLIASKMWR